MALVEMTIRREEIGAKLATGLEGWARSLGEASGHVDALRKMTVHVKGAGIPLHDYRAYQAKLFSFLIAGYGPGHFGGGGGADVRWPGHESVSANLEEALAKVDSVRLASFDKVWTDSLGVCLFATWVSGSQSTTAEALRHATGWDDFAAEEALGIGERIVNALRLIYQRRGFVKQNEFDYGARVTEAAPAGPTQGKSVEPFIRAMVDEYYRQMGWDVDTGYLTPATVERFGLWDLRVGDPV